jgi:MYXO-CTERM domain-containing protein
LKGESCETGICIPDDAPCTPMCQGLECGEDGCGGSCGTCVDGKVCGAGLCSDDTDQPGPDVLSDASEVDGGGTAGGGGSKSGGCTATDSGGQTSLLLMLLLAMALVGVRRTSVVQR